MKRLRDLVDTKTINVNFQLFVAKVIGKVRKMIKIFRKSPLKNEILQVHNQIQFNAKLKLILDSKNRWNSLLEMTKTFVKVEK